MRWARASVAAALVCGGQILATAQPVAAVDVASFTTVGTFSYEVPAGVECVSFVVEGAQGGGNAGGAGGRATGKLSVVPGQTLQVNVGGRPADDAGGSNGGGAGGNWGGGGASDIRQGGTTLDHRVVVAGGGGGEGAGTAGGAGGGLNGTDGGADGPFGAPGRGGTQVAGGAGGGGAGSGVAGSGGAGSSGLTGGGGGGFFGGGGGDNGDDSDSSAGGGGGSGLGPIGTQFQTGERAGNGTVEITSPAPGSCTSGTADFTGGSQAFRVPSAVTCLTVDASGAQGDTEPFGGGTGVGGRGGRVTGVVPVTAGDLMLVSVGGQGAGTSGGFNGGGGSTFGRGGGGATDLRRDGVGLVHRVLVAAGGGGGATSRPGGAGGGLTGSPGSTGSNAGQGGTQTGGGAPGSGPFGTGGPGVLGAGGGGFNASGGGGGGLWGGGGGGGGNTGEGDGGGGGSSLVPDVGFTQSDVRAGNGTLSVSFAPGQPCSFTFPFTGQPESISVPDSVRCLSADAFGAQGGNVGGLGGRATGTFAVTPGESLALIVGGAGGVTAGGFNGGGSAADGGGGGATDVRQGGGDFDDRVIVAGGGGGYAGNLSPGHGGGLNGADASGFPDVGGGGGSQTAGGAAPDGASPGTFGVGGASAATVGGAGGGGWYGGGGGIAGGSGGGGSGFGPPGVVFQTGVREDNGELTLTWTPGDTSCRSGEIEAVDSAQWFKVPTGVTCVDFTLSGGEGGGFSGGARGGRARSELVVTPGELLQVNVGGQGEGNIAGFNGGGLRGTGSSINASAVGSGGGATDVRQGGTDLSARVLVAGGGGGLVNGTVNGGVGGENGGDGGGTTEAVKGRGGAQLAGGAGGSPGGTAGQAGQGGSGGSGVSPGGGGGGGWFGGGGGGSSDVDGGGGGGGGGSSHGPVGTVFAAGVQAGDGLAELAFEPGVDCTPPPSSPITCGPAGPTLAVTIVDPGTLSISRAGNVIVVTPSGPGCSGFTVLNTDTIDVAGSSGADTVVLDLTNGQLVPGLTPEPGTVAEIEINVNLAAGSDTVEVKGTPNADTMVAGTNGLLVSGDNDIDVFPTGVETFKLLGQGGNDAMRSGGSSIAGGSVAATLDGGPGADTIVGGALNDTVLGGIGLDALQGGYGADTVEGGADNDTIYGGDGADILRGGPGNDVIYGDTGNDTFDEEAATNGADTFWGGSGTDTLSYAGRSAALVVILNGVAGSGQAGEGDKPGTDLEHLIGGSGADKLTGNALNNTITGGLGVDELYGVGGNDLLLALDGVADTVLDGGVGTDTAQRDGFDPAIGVEVFI